MKRLITLIVLLMAIDCVLVHGAEFSWLPSKIEIDCQKTKIKVGEPLVLKVRFVWPQPMINPETGSVRNVVSANAQIMVTEEVEQESVLRRDSFKAIDLHREGERGDSYGSYIVAFYDFGVSSLMFDKPGVYSLKLTSGKRSSNILTIEVDSAGEAEKEAIELLSDPDYYRFLERGEILSGTAGERRQRIQEVFERCSSALVGKWAGARLGIELVEEFTKKYTAAEEFIRAYRKGEAKEPLVEQAYDCLSGGLELPDGFAIREEVLARMISVEITKGNYPKCFEYANELELRYPEGRFGSEAAEIRSTIQRLEVEEPYDASEANVTEIDEPSSMLFVAVGGAGLAAIVIAGLVVLGKKRGK